MIDLELGFPGANVMMALGHAGRPLLAPLALRTTPLPTWARVLLVAGLAGAGSTIAIGLRRRS